MKNKKAGNGLFINTYIKAFLLAAFFLGAAFSQQKWVLLNSVTKNYDYSRAMTIQDLVAQSIQAQGDITVSILDDSLTKETEKRKKILEKNNADIGVSSRVTRLDSTVYIYLDKWNRDGISVFKHQLDIKVGSSIKEMTSCIAGCLVNEKKEKFKKEDISYISIQPGEKQLTLAFMGFKPVGIEENSALVITDKLINGIFKAGTCTIVERVEMKSILREQGFQMTGCVSSSCSVEAGQLLGVDKMLVGSISKIKGLYMVNVRIIDVETGKIEQYIDEEVQGGIADIINIAIPSIVYKITGKKIQSEKIELPDEISYGEEYVDYTPTTLYLQTYPKTGKIYLNGEYAAQGRLKRTFYNNKNFLKCVYEDSVKTFTVNPSKGNRKSVRFIYLDNPLHFVSWASWFFYGTNKEMGINLFAAFKYKYNLFGINGFIGTDIEQYNSLRGMGFSFLHQFEFNEIASLFIGGTIGRFKKEKQGYDYYDSDYDIYEDIYPGGPMVKFNVGYKHIHFQAAFNLFTGIVEIETDDYFLPVYSAGISVDL